MPARGQVWLRAGQRIQRHLWIRCGVSSATFSISTPPSVDAMKITRRVARSTTADTAPDRCRSPLQQDLVYRLTIGVSLVGHQTFAQPVFSESTNVFFTVNHLHRPLYRGHRHEPDISPPRTRANFRGGFFGFTWRGAGITSRCWHTIPCKQLLRYSCKFMMFYPFRSKQG